jgi:hypothetical protein
MSLRAAIRAYGSHPDPATAMACFVALVLGANGPFYPLYVIAVVGWARGHAAFLTMGAMPLFLAVPALARSRPEAARVALWLVGTVNTVWCMKLFGPESGVGLFLLPCIALAALLQGRLLTLAAVGLPILPLLMPATTFGPPILALTAAENARLTTLNGFSAACLMGLLTLRLASMLRGPDA